MVGNFNFTFKEFSKNYSTVEVDSTVYKSTAVLFLYRGKYTVNTAEINTR